MVKTKTMLEVPQLGNDSEVVAARETLNRIKRDKAETARAIDAELAKKDSGSQDARQARVAALLAGEDLNGRGVPDATRIAELTQRRRDLGEAEQEAQRRLSAAECAASDRALEAVRPEYTERVRQLAEALVALGDAADALAGCHEAFDDAGLKWPGRIGPTVALGWMSGRDPSSRLSILCSELVDGYGLNIERAGLDAELGLRQAASRAESARQQKLAREGKIVAASSEGVTGPGITHPWRQRA